MVPKKQNITAFYYENLQFCTKTVSDLYFKYQQYYPKEYLGLISQRNPNGIIIRIPKIQPSDDIELKVLRIKNHGKDFTLDELEDLTNAWVYLEYKQDPLEYLDVFFEYIIDELQLTKYHIKQIYLDLELDEEDNYDKDPDYNPYTDNEDYFEELEYSSDNNEPTKVEDDDYVPSVESEDEYENTQRTYVAKKKPVKKYKKKTIY
jgi:hypothetical protein